MTSTVPPGSGSGGKASTTLPVWRACPTNRNASPARSPGHARTGSGRKAPAANRPTISARISPVRSGPASARSNAR